MSLGLPQATSSRAGTRNEVVNWLLVLLGTGLALAQDITGGLNNTPKQLLKGGLNNSFGVIVGGGGGGGGTGLQTGRCN